MKTYCALFLVTVLVVGCKKPESTPPPAPAPQPPPAAQAPAELPPGHPPIDMMQQALPPGSAAEAPNPRWDVPQGWVESKPGPMRRANFLAGGEAGQSAEIVISAFPGDVGGQLANINRWRGQIGMGSISEKQAADLTRSFELNGATVTMVDVTSDKPTAGKAHPQRMIVATIPHNGDSWFFKITGDAPFVAAQEATFLAFVKSVKF